VLVARALNPSFPEPVRAALGNEASGLLRRLRDKLVACSPALRAAAAYAIILSTTPAAIEYTDLARGMNDGAS
jgi:hypothetical protein